MEHKNGNLLCFSVLYQALIRLFRDHSSNPSKPAVFLSAYTGMAAKNIEGSTLHSLLGLCFGTTPQSVREVSTSSLNTYWCALAEMRVLMIDEISFVGSNFLHCIDERLRAIRQIDKPFGGLTVLCFGDILQLEPVRDGNVFEICKSHFSQIPGTVWRNFEMFELTEIMRQHDNSWCELLRRLRVGKLLPEDYVRLNKLVHQNVSEGIPRAYRLSCKVKSHNEEAFENFSGEKIQIDSVDKIKGEFGDCGNFYDALRLAKGMTVDQTSGLSSKLNVAVGLPYMMTINVDKEDGFVNGCTGILMDITYQNSSPFIL